MMRKLNPRSTVVDLGCGNGAQAYHIQKMGFDVTGTDVVNALEYELNNFILDDALQSKLTKKYDVIIDRGLIHNLFHLKETRHKYFEMIGNITHDDSYIILKVRDFSRFHFFYSSFLYIPKYPLRCGCKFV